MSGANGGATVAGSGGIAGMGPGGGAAAPGEGGDGEGGGGEGGDGGSAGGGGAAGAAGSGGGAGAGETYDDFPEQPVVGLGVPAKAAELFGEPGNFRSGDICVMEPALSSGESPGGLYPTNWLRPRFKFRASSLLNLFEIRVHHAAQRHDLVIYTTEQTAYVPKDVWSDGVFARAAQDAFRHADGLPFTVTIRGVNIQAPATPAGVSGDFDVAPVELSGSVLFHAVSSGRIAVDTSALRGFSVADEGVQDVLTLGTLNWRGQISEDGSVLNGYYDSPQLAGFTNGQVRCLGCHQSTPDGQAAILMDGSPGEKAAAAIRGSTRGVVPGFIASGASAIMRMTWWGTQTMNPAHFVAGNRVLVTSIGVGMQDGRQRTDKEMGWFAPSYQDLTNMPRITKHELAWIDLDSTAPINVSVTNTPDYGPSLQMRQLAANSARGSGWDTIATGDAASAVLPTFNHAGSEIAYTATDFSPDGHPDYSASTADIKVVPYNGRAGGTGEALTGASDPRLLEYYPAYSPDDRFVAFVQAPAPDGAAADGPYYNRHGQVMIIPAQGGIPTRLAANDGSACAGDVAAGGLINSWPRWAPETVSLHGKTYYFIVFTSARNYRDEFSQRFELDSPNSESFAGLRLSSQLWLTAIVVDDETGEIRTYPALYLWNQNRLVGSSGAPTNTTFSHLTPTWDAAGLPPLVIE